MIILLVLACSGMAGAFGYIVGCEMDAMKSLEETAKWCQSVQNDNEQLKRALANVEALIKQYRLGQGPASDTQRDAPADVTRRRDPTVGYETVRRPRG